MARDAVAEVRDRTDIVDLVSSYVQLKRTGRSYKGLCPFHQEKTPSFVVFPDSGNFHCFGCGRGGDAFAFYMGVEHVEFREALQELAKRAGVTLATSRPAAPEPDGEREKLVALNEHAASFYASTLREAASGAPGRRVLEQRGVSAEMVEQFGLGYAPDGDVLRRRLHDQGYSDELGVAAGLVVERDGGGFRDRFRNRLLFPIRTREGETVGFGGRALGDAIPKYLNSPQSAIFDKSALLYGLDHAQEAARHEERIVIVEGYMDAIAAHQFGYANVVAAMGTAITERQIGLVKRLSRNIVLALDADAAGQGATIRSLEMLPEALDSDLKSIDAGRQAGARTMILAQRRFKARISVMRLPEGKDPDELIRRDPTSWPNVVADAVPLLEFYVDSVLAGVDPADAEAKSQALDRILALLAFEPDTSVQEHYVGLIARRLLYRPDFVARRLKGAAVVAVDSQRQRTNLQVVQQSAQEDHLVALLLRHRAICQGLLPLVRVEYLSDPRNREILRILQDPTVPFDLTAESIVAGLDDLVADHAEALLARLEQTPLRYPAQIERDAREAVRRLARDHYDALLSEIQSSIASAEASGESEEVAELRHRLAELSQWHRQFYPPPSPYFRDSRDSGRAQAASGR